MPEFVVSASDGRRSADLVVPAENAAQAAAMVRQAVRVPDRVMPRGSASTGRFAARPVSVLNVRANQPFGFR